MAKKGNRRHVVLRHKETGHTYHTTKNVRNTTERLEIIKYNPMIREHVSYREEK